MIRHKIIAQHFGTDKNYDEILGDNSFNEILKETLNECLKEHLPNCISWPRALFFHPAYSQCGGMTFSGYCCNFKEYKRTFFTETSFLSGEARSLIVAGMVYAIFSVQKTRIQGTSDFLDDLERYLENYNFFHHFKRLVKQTKSRYTFDFSIKLNLNDRICCWELDDFSDALQISVCGNFIDTHFYEFLNLPWRQKYDRLVVLERIKEYFNYKYHGKFVEVDFDGINTFQKVLLDDSFYPMYEKAKKIIESELDKDFKDNVKQKINNKKNIPDSPKKAFINKITRPEKAQRILKRLHDLIDRQDKPKDIIKPLCAAICAGAVSRDVSCTEFVTEFGHYNKRTYSVNRKKYENEKWRKEDEDFKLLVKEFNELTN